MRVTTQMLNETARRSGLPFACNTLLNQVNGGSTGNALLEALNNKKSSTYPNAGKRLNYEKLEKSANRLQNYTNIEDLVENYNSTMKELRSLPDTMNDFYQYMLKQAATENKEALSSIGITIAKDGLLKVDADRMKQADMESIKKVLSGSESFGEKTAFLAGRISDNAGANAKSTSNQYNAAGNTYSALLNRYDFRS